MSLAERRRCVTYLKNTYEVSERRACRAMQIHRSSYRFEGRTRYAATAYQRVVNLSRQYPRWGYRKIYFLLLQEGIAIARETVRLIRRREGLQVLKKRRKHKVLGQTTHWVHRACYPNHVWSYDFVFDQTDDGRTLKCLTVVDEFTRQSIAIRVGRHMNGHDVKRILTELFKIYGCPSCIRSDNGSELISSVVKDWLKKNHVGTHYIDPGSPWQNAFSESFNSIFRTTCLDIYLFSSLTEARVLINQWREEYNTIRPHGSLNGLSPNNYLNNWLEQSSQQPEILTG